MKTKDIAGKIAFATFGGLLVCGSAQASLNLSALDTGAGQYAKNNGAVLTDGNWSVSLLSANQTPPGGNPNGTAYLVSNNQGIAFTPGFWAANDSTSTWVTYSTPLQTAGNNANATFQYQLTFTVATSGTLDVNFLSDNNSTLFVDINGTSVNDTASSANPYSTWASSGVLNLIAGQVCTIDLDVNTTSELADPTGARVELSGTATVVSVPETTTIFAGAMLLMPLGVGMMRIMRKNKQV